MRSYRGHYRKPKHMLFVGGLSASTTEQDLWNHFYKYAKKIDSIKIMIDRKSKQSKGYAMISLPIDQKISHILAESHTVCDRKVDVQMAAKKSEKKQLKEDLKKRKLFVNGLPVDFVGADIEKFFSQFGKIKSGYIIKDFDSGTSKGYGFIEFEDTEVARQVLVKDIYIEGKKLEMAQYKYKYEPKSEANFSLQFGKQSDPQLSSEGSSSKHPRDDSECDLSEKPDSPGDTPKEKKEISILSLLHTKEDNEEDRTHKYEYIRNTKYINENPANYVFWIRSGNGDYKTPIVDTRGAEEYEQQNLQWNKKENYQRISMLHSVKISNCDTHSEGKSPLAHVSYPLTDVNRRSDFDRPSGL